MKQLRNSMLAACLAMAGAVQAAVPPTLLLRDTFDAATGNVNDLNVDLARQSGLLAPVSYTLAGGPGHYGHQLQNGNALNQLLVADFPNSTSSLNVNFNGANSAGGLKISFDLDSVPTVYGGDPGNWGCVNLGMSAADQMVNVNGGQAHFGILFRATGTIQAFDGGSVVSPGPEPVYSILPPGSFNHIDLIITDADGNPFDGSGNTVIDVYANGSVLPVYSFTKAGGYANNYINVQGSFRAHFDNLEISRLDPGFENPSFEANSFTVFPGYVSGNGGNNAIVGWTASGRAGLNPASGSPFANNGAIPNGSQVAFIQNAPDSSLSAVIPNLTIGQAYKVNFRVNARGGNTPNLKVDVDGNNIINSAVTQVGGSNPYKFFAFDFTATATSQTMTLRNDAGDDNTVVLDDFSIAPSTGSWSYAAWSDDASSGVDGSKPYTHAYNLGGAVNTTINGVLFTGVGGGNPSVANKFSTAGLPNVLSPDANNVTGGSRALANDFLYGGPGQSITLDGLVVGGEYIATIYSVGWENGTRAATFNVGSDRLTVNQDHFGDNNGIRISYRYLATASSITLRFDQLQGNSIHVYGFSNLELSNPDNVPPTITSQPQDVTVGLGDVANFAVSALGSRPLIYQWYFGADALPDATNATLSVLADFPDLAGDYSVVVSNGAGTETSRIAKLTVRAKVPGLFNTGVDDSGATLPNIDGTVDPHYSLIVNADSASTDALVHNETIFPIVSGPWMANTAGSKWIGPRFDTVGAAGLAQGNGTYVYRTSFDLTGLDHNTVVITGGWAVDNAGVSIKVNGIPTGLVNGNGFGGLTAFTINSLNATFIAGVNTLDFEVQNADAAAGYTALHVGNLRGLAELPGTPVSIVSQPQGADAGTGEAINFAVVTVGSSPIEYQWRKDGADILGANGPTYSIASAALTDAGIYTVHVSNMFGQETSANAVVTVRDSVPGLFNTGVDDGKVALDDGLVDPHYKLIVNPDSASSDAIVENSTVFPIVTGPWVANNAGSKWVGPRVETSAAAGAEDAGGDYTYRTTVDLTGFDPASVVITGVWSTDNGGIDIIVNGHSTGQPNTDQFVAFTPFTINSHLVAGVNTIDFKLNNSSVGYTGLRVDRIRGVGTALPPNTAPFIVTQPQDTAVGFNEFATFQVVANGSAPLSYQWFFGPDALPGETGQSLTFLVEFPDQAGEYHVEVSNGFGSITSDVATLTTPNQPPTFVPGPDQTVLEDAGPMTVSPWATGMDAGGFGDAGQTLTFLVSNNNPGLFSVQPSVALDGTLSFRSAPNANGSAVVTVVLMDDGGTANGGIDRSAPADFRITVTPVNDCPVAKANVSPLYAHSSLTTLTVLALCSTNGYAILDGTTSTDADGDALSYAWWVDGASAASGSRATNVFGLGTHTVALTVNDGGCDGLDTVSIEVISGSEIVEILIDEVEATTLNTRVKRSLNSHLKTTQTALDRCDVPLALAQLEAFKNKLRVLIQVSQESLRSQLTESTQAIIDAINAAQALQSAVESLDVPE